MQHLWKIIISTLFLMNSLLLKSCFSIFKKEIGQYNNFSELSMSIANTVCLTFYALGQFSFGILLNIRPKIFIIYSCLTLSLCSFILSYSSNKIIFFIFQSLLYVSLAGSNIIFIYICTNYLPKNYIGIIQSILKMLCAIVVFVTFNNPIVCGYKHSWQFIMSIIALVAFLCTIILFPMNYKSSQKKVNIGNILYSASDTLIWLLAFSLGLISLGVTFIQDGYFTYFNSGFSKLLINLVALLYPILAVIFSFISKYIDTMNIIITISVLQTLATVITTMYFNSYTVFMFTICCACSYSIGALINCIINRISQRQFASLYCSLVSAIQVILSGSIGIQFFRKIIYSTWKYHGTCYNNTPVFHKFDIRYCLFYLCLCNLLSTIIFVFCKKKYLKQLSLN